MKPFFAFALAAFLSLSLGCKKTASDTERCPEVLSDRQPDKVTLRFVDKVSGENLLGRRLVPGSDISLKETVTGTVLTHWGS